MTSRIRYIATMFGFVALWAHAQMAHAEEITVFAAASMADAVTEIGDIFSLKSPQHEVRYVFASSSTLARQIIAGAPAHIYISANRAWMHAAVDAGTMVPETVRPIVQNRLVLISASGNGSVLPDGLPTIISPTFPLIRLLGTDSYNRLAIGDPSHVPAGQYARQALEYFGFWHSVSGRLAPMPHVRAALNLVARDEAPLGIVYASDMGLTPNLKIIATFPETSHLPIIYLTGMVKSDMVNFDHSTGPTSFFAFLTSPEAAQVFQHHGFSSILSALD